MTATKKIIFKTFFFLAFVLVFSSCEKDDETTSDPNQATGKVAIEITDAPIDNTNIEGAFVTVAEVKVDGEAISSFNGKQTIDLMAYQNGDTKALGLAELETGTYTNVTLVLDYSADVDGNAPGCYVLATDGTKHSLQNTTSSTGEITISNGAFIVSENSITNFVLDFDVRKAIKKEDNPEPNDEYDFVTEAELQTSVRLLDKESSAKVTGKVSDVLGMSGDRIVVYAYKKGSYNESVELEGQGSSEVTFKNAVSSCIVEANGEYNLSFLSEGEYELHYMSYEEEGSDGEMNLEGSLNVSTLLSLDVLGLQLDASADVELDVTIIGINPI